MYSDPSHLVFHAVPVNDVASQTSCLESDLSSEAYFVDLCTVYAIFNYHSDGVLVELWCNTNSSVADLCHIFFL